MKYWLNMILSSILTVLAVAALRYAVDEYGLFGFPRIARFNYNKPYVSTQEEQFKRSLGFRGGFENVVIGNSRVNHGIRLENWPVSEGSIANLGYGGQELAPSYDLIKLLSTSKNSRLKRVF